MAPECKTNNQVLLFMKVYSPDTPPATYAAIISPTEKPMCTVRGSPRVFRLRTV